MRLVWSGAESHGVDRENVGEMANVGETQSTRTDVQSVCVCVFLRFIGRERVCVGGRKQFRMHTRTAAVMRSKANGACVFFVSFECRTCWWCTVCVCGCVDLMVVKQKKNTTTVEGLLVVDGGEW